MLKGYDSVNPLTTAEKQSVYYVLCATYLKGHPYYAESTEAAALVARNNKALVFLSQNKKMFQNLL